MAATSKYAIYCGTAQPGLGPRRSYIGLVRVDRWGASPQEAADSRFHFHMERPAKKGSAVWLRPCSDAVWEVVDTDDDYPTALKKELYHTLTTMASGGPGFAALVRGACFVRVQLPWGDVVSLLDLVKGNASGMAIWAVFMFFREFVRKSLAGHMVFRGPKTHGKPY